MEHCSFFSYSLPGSEQVSTVPFKPQHQPMRIFGDCLRGPALNNSTVEAMKLNFLSILHLPGIKPLALVHSYLLGETNPPSCSSNPSLTSLAASFMTS